VETRLAGETGVPFFKGAVLHRALHLFEEEKCAPVPLFICVSERQDEPGVRGAVLVGIVVDIPLELHNRRPIVPAPEEIESVIEVAFGFSRLPYPGSKEEEQNKNWPFYHSRIPK